MNYDSKAVSPEYNNIVNNTPKHGTKPKRGVMGAMHPSKIIAR